MVKLHKKKKKKFKKVQAMQNHLIFSLILLCHILSCADFFFLRPCVKLLLTFQLTDRNIEPRKTL